MDFRNLCGLNHASIIENPTDELVSQVIDALGISSLSQFNKWVKTVTEKSHPVSTTMEQWQQFVVRARDERGDGITDYNLQLYRIEKGKDPGNAQDWEPISIDVHSYSTDTSFRCFHINLKELLNGNLENLRLEFMASTGTVLLGCLDHTDEKNKINFAKGQPTFIMDLTPLVQDEKTKFFFPFTTTLLEIILNREPLPLGKRNEITWFLSK
jgi:hypothetical protein